MWQLDWNQNCFYRVASIRKNMADGDPSVFDMNIEVLREANSTSMVQMIKY